MAARDGLDFRTRWVALWILGEIGTPLVNAARQWTIGAVATEQRTTALPIFHETLPLIAHHDVRAMAGYPYARASLT